MRRVASERGVSFRFTCHSIYSAPNCTQLWASMQPKYLPSTYVQLLLGLLADYFQAAPNYFDVEVRQILSTILNIYDFCRKISLSMQEGRQNYGTYANHSGYTPGAGCGQEAGDTKADGGCHSAGAGGRRPSAACDEGHLLCSSRNLRLQMDYGGAQHPPGGETDLVRQRRRPDPHGRLSLERSAHGLRFCGDSLSLHP